MVNALSPSPQELAGLRSVMERYFNLDELRTVCFDLGIDHENVPGATKSAFVRELIALSLRRGQYTHLVELCVQERPHLQHHLALLTERFGIGQSRTESIAIRELPLEPLDFVGRSAELTCIQDELRKTNRNIVVIRGMGGVGKTALGLKLATRFQERSPYAQFFLDLNGTSDNSVVRSADILLHVVRGLFPHAELPESDQALAGVYRSALSNTPCLVFLDNARSLEQILPALPPGESLLIVTSRWRFSVPNAVELDLLPMRQDESEELLLRVYPPFERSAGAVASLCGYLPLAMCVVARTLGERPDLEPSDLTRRLEKKSQRLIETGVALGLKASYDLLPAPLAPRFADLGVYPDSFERNSVAALWVLDTDETLDCLGALLSCSLVQWNDASQRYSLHDLVRDFTATVRVKVNDSESRFVSFFLTYLSDNVGDYPGLEVERSNLLHAQALSLKHNKWREVITFGRELKEYLRLAGHWRDLEDVLNAGLRASRECNSEVDEAWFMHELSHLFTSSGRYVEATELANGSLQLGRRLGNTIGIAVSLRQLGLIARRLNRPDEALALIDESFILYRSVGDKYGMAMCLHTKAGVFRDLGKLEQAMLLYQESLAFRRTLADRNSIGASLFQLANVAFELGQLEVARSHCLESLEYSDDVVFRARANALQGRIFAKEGKYAEAIRLLETSKNAIASLPSPESVRTDKYLAQVRAMANQEKANNGH